MTGVSGQVLKQVLDQFGAGTEIQLDCLPVAEPQPSIERQRTRVRQRRANFQLSDAHLPGDVG